MLLHLSRASFWLAALAAACSLVGPRSFETASTVVAGIAALLALALWRSSLLVDRRSPVIDAAVPQAALLTNDTLVEAAAAIVRAADQAMEFDAAVQAAANVLRGELGARAVHVHLANKAAPALAQPVSGAMNRAMRSGAPLIDLPARVVVPVDGEASPAAWIELCDIEMTVDPQALASLLELTGVSLRGVQKRLAGARERALPMPEPVAAVSLPAARKFIAHVLVVEDNVVQSETTARKLRRLGCHVTMASGMLEGLHTLCATQFDLVLMDTHMPGVSASEALNWLRDRSQGAFQLESVRGTPVVAMCWNGSHVDAERYKALGFDDCIFKPLRLRQLHSMLSTHVRMRAPLPEAGGSSAVGAPDVLDSTALARLRELDPKGENQLVERVLKAFQTSAARLGPQLQTARTSNDRATVRLVAHTLKSSSASIGALVLSQQCADLEALIRNEPEADVEPGIAAISESLEAALRAIQRELGTPA